MADELREALTDYLAEQDKDDWCQRLKYGQCSLRKCLVDKEGRLRTPGSYDGATCARFRLEQALSQTPDSAVEREKVIVAWLRTVKIAPDTSPSEFTSVIDRSFAKVLELVADAIERGEHLRSGSDD